jgi:hypothetical protein
MQNNYNTPKKLVPTQRRYGTIYEVRDDAGLTYATAEPIEDMGWDITHKSGKIYALMCKNTPRERKEVFVPIKTQDYYKYNRIFYKEGELIACIESVLIGDGR